jgi:beta-galactosidase
VTADAAVLADTGSRWALESRGLPSPHVRHLDVARAAHAALWRSGIGCDIAGPDSDLSPYRLVVVPAVYLLSDDAATALRRYTEDGGHLVVTFCSGIADQWHHIRTGGYPGALRDILGIRAQEFHPLELAATIALTAAEGASALDGARGRLWSERLRADGAEVLARYGDGVLAGLPAITRHSYGTGTAWYLSTLPDDQALGTVLREAAAASAVPPALPGAPPGVCVSRRHGDSGSWLFAFNHGAAAVTVPAAGLDLLTGREITGTLELPPAGVAVIREVPPKITPARPPARPVALRD